MLFYSNKLARFKQISIFLVTKQYFIFILQYF